MSSLTYPRLGTGALSQYPIHKTHRARTVVNASADRSTVRLADPGAETVEWRLQYVDLTDDEAAALTEFFEQAEGSLNGFTFLDPASNLLSWSGQLDEDVWQRDPFLQIADGVTDPVGGTMGWQVSNPGAGPQSLAQTIAAPGGYWYCFSAYLRSEVPVTVRMMIGGESVERVVSTEWGRVTYAATPSAEAQSVRFGIELTAGSTVKVYGPQVDAQQGASAYRATTRGGVYEDAHLGTDVFSVTRTACNRNSCTV